MTTCSHTLVSSPPPRVPAQTISQFVGFVNPRGPFFGMWRISVNCRRRMKWQPPPPPPPPSPHCSLLQRLRAPLPGGNDTKRTPVFLSARLLWGCFLNRLWQGDLCFLTTMSCFLPGSSRKSFFFLFLLAVKKVEGKRKRACFYQILWSFNILQEDRQRNTVLGSGTEVEKTARCEGTCGHTSPGGCSQEVLGLRGNKIPRGFIARWRTFLSF